jgi:hypothetical protein
MNIQDLSIGMKVKVVKRDIYFGDLFLDKVVEIEKIDANDNSCYVTDHIRSAWVDIRSLEFVSQSAPKHKYQVGDRVHIIKDSYSSTVNTKAMVGTIGVVKQWNTIHGYQIESPASFVPLWFREDSLAPADDEFVQTGIIAGAILDLEPLVKTSPYVAAAVALLHNAIKADA